ncbi:MAG: DUF1573 domain-containing protein [Bacteroidales bacterium]|nr:DUF1573 domain-containing protein [Bacteroidales bacterium]
MTTFLSILASVLVAVPVALNFVRTSFDFGDHPAQERELVCEFPFTNVSDHPVSIAYAVASCSCTKLTWTTEPVLPGQSGVVTAVYTKERYVDQFTKQITVMVEGESQPYFLSFSGYFHETPASLFQDFKYRRGILCLEYDPLELGLVSAGVESKGRFEIANFSENSISISFENVSPGLDLSFNSIDLDPYNRTFVRYSFVPDTLSRGRIEYSFTPVVDSVSLGPVFIRAVETDDFSSLSSAERNAGSFPKLNASQYDFGSIDSGQDAVFTITLSNVSETPLHIQSMFANRKGVSFDYPQVVEGRAEATLTVTIGASALRIGNNRFKLSIVCDSPLVPYIETFVNGYVK